ncbi:gamma-glutamyltranspeptidase/glutathione hydrolase [Georgenia soli]|uniref:Glutathione hydrolase proenzyme n=1 Tax=Georgenia soli TaxID=638953 RepID=A0A2A9EK43_9MICO|nr:gamma-glutamyltransferase [Georgenia soli]PFG39447.1 gamma-glutamyltranspeptidase/glutathione hydrolase [Georgenia soli]
MSGTVLRRGRVLALLAMALALVAALVVGASPAGAEGGDGKRDGNHGVPHPPRKEATATGYGGAVTSLDPYATRAGMEILEKGGNAVDAAIATSAMLGVTRPYDGSIGGGGFFLIYDAENDEVTSIDARETAPLATPRDVFLENGKEIPFDERRVSGLSQGVPGVVAGWELALEEYGTMPLHKLLQPARVVAERGFVVDEEYVDRTTDNLEIFRDFTSSRETFLVDGKVPAVGSIFRNPDLARTYKLIGRDGADAFYEGEVAEAIVDTVQHPPVVAGAERNVRPGLMELGDLDDYEAKWRDPTMVDYRDHTVFGMGPPSSGGTTVGEALNILEGYELSELPENDVLHLLIEAEALAFADRGKYLGDPDFVDVPVEGLLSQDFADERRELIREPFAATKKPLPAGTPDGAADDGVVLASAPMSTGSTTHLTTTDRWGNIVALTFTIEQIGGSGIAVDGYGFLLNNELTDFATDPNVANSPDGGKRPRSSISPTIMFGPDGEPFVAYGTPGGATIITTVLQVAVNLVDLDMDLPDAIAAPRLGNGNSENTNFEATLPVATQEALKAYGHKLPTPAAEPIGNVNGVQFLGDDGLLAAAEPTRFHGGSAAVLEPWPH